MGDEKRQQTVHRARLTQPPRDGAGDLGKSRAFGVDRERVIRLRQNITDGGNGAGRGRSGGLIDHASA